MSYLHRFTTMRPTHQGVLSRALIFMLLLLLFVSACPPASAQSPIIYYVSPTNLGSGSCNTWGNACNLQQALRTAPAGAQIWVMAGTYQPGINRSDAFALKDNIALYGGFKGDETSLEQRILFKYPSILSGDIQNDDGSNWANNDDNSYHVVVADTFGDPERITTLMDGFTIIGGNANENNADSEGGGIRINNVSIRLSNLFITGNAALRGGGINCVNYSKPELINVQFLHNQAVNKGGGFNSENGCIASLYGNAFQANRAATGGAANNSFASLVLINNSISGNTASANGGGLFTNNGSLIMHNSIIWGNYPQQVYKSGTNDIAVSTNIIQADDSGIPSLEIEDPGFSQNPSSGPDTIWGTADDVPGDLHLRRDSLAIDIGANEWIPDALSRDLRNWPRKILAHPTAENPDIPVIDLGSYEAGPIRVKQNGPGLADGSSWQNAFSDLQAGLDFAHAGEEVWVAQGTYIPGTTRSSSFLLKSDVAVYGGFAGDETLRATRNWETHPTLLSGDRGISGDSSDNSYHVVTASSAGPGSILDGFTIHDGRANGSGANEDRGGGIFINDSDSLQLENLLITDCQAALGGAIYSSGSDYMLSSTTLLRNSAHYGGGIYNNNASTPQLIGVFFHGNTAANSDATHNDSRGGGLYNDNSASPDISNAVFAGNQAAQAGGVYSTRSAAPKLRNVTLAANPGGAFYSNNSPANQTLLANVIAWDNTARPFTLVNSSPLIVTSLLAGGCPIAALCQGVRSSDPLFFRPPTPGPDTVWGTIDDDYGDLRVMSQSEAVDLGSNSYVLVEKDIAGQQRFVDAPTPLNSGNDPSPVVDMGAYEAVFAASVTKITAISPSLSTAGQPVIVSFKVSGLPELPASGTVTISDGTSQCSADVRQGACSLVFATGGEKALTAAYTGDTFYGASRSESTVHHVSPGENQTYINIIRLPLLLH